MFCATQTARTTFFLRRAIRSTFRPCTRHSRDPKARSIWPTVVAIAPGKSLEHYIGAAGGPSRRLADAGGAYVIQPNGKIESRHRVLLLFRSDPTPRAGATVIVPVRDTTNNTAATLQTISIVTGIIATLLTAYALVKR